MKAHQLLSHQIKYNIKQEPPIQEPSSAGIEEETKKQLESFDKKYNEIYN